MGATPNVTYTYDDATAPVLRECLTKVASSASTWQILGFDALGRPTSSQQITAGQTFTFPNYSFNLADKLISVTYPIYGRVVSTTYDLAGRPVGASGVLNSVATTYASVPLPPSSGYASHGALQQVTLGNNWVEQSCFNNRLQPTVMRVGSGATSNCANSGVDPLNLGYGYTSGSNNGNVASQTITRWTGSSWSAAMNYSSYDGLNRLTNTSEGSAWSEANGYDEFGNRWANITGLTTTLETPTTQSWYTNGSHSTNNQIYQWGYDGAGNVTSVSGMSRAFSYDGENRQTLATINSTQVTTYVYDGDGRRVQKTGPGGTTTYVYDAQGQLAQESGPATLGTSYLTTDALGSTRLLTDGSGAQLKCYDYTPFGTEIPSGVDGRPSCYGSVVYPSAPDVVTEKFTSKERDAETGLDFFGSRYYSSAQGRFTSPDQPLLGQDRNNPQSWNLYSYSLNNPLRYIDPNGHNAEESDDDCGIHLKDCGPAIGPLHQTTGLGQTQDRVVGILQGLAITGLDLLELLPGNHDTIDDLKRKLGPSSQNQQFGQDVGGILAAVIPTGNSKEIKIATSSFEEARNTALKLMGEIDPATRQATVGRVGELRGEVTGFVTKAEDASKQFRLDWDPNKGAHINVTIGGTKFAVTFPASLDQVKTLLKGNVQK